MTGETAAFKKRWPFLLHKLTKLVKNDVNYSMGAIDYNNVVADFISIGSFTWSNINYADTLVAKIVGILKKSIAVR